jgi:hypothetical protein
LKRFNDDDDDGQSAAASFIYSVAEMAFSTKQDQKTAASRLEKSSKAVPARSSEARGLVGVMCSNNRGNDPAYRRDERADESSNVRAGGAIDGR